MDRALAQSPMQQVRDALPGLNAAMTRVAQLVLDHPQEVGRAPITRLAEQAQTSPATVTRLAVLLGYDGYPALRAAIAEENGRDAQAAWESDIGRMISPDDPADQVLTTLAGTQANAMRVALGAIDLPTASRVADAIAAAGRIHLFGEWGDAVVVQELHLRLLRIGRPCWFHSGRQEAQVVASLVGPGDVALTLSRSGHDPVAEDFLTRARDHGATTVLITGVPGVPLEQAADEVLHTGTPNGSAWTDYFGGRASDVLTASLLFVLVAQRSADSLERAFLSGAHHVTRNQPPRRGPQRSRPTPRRPEADPERPEPVEGRDPGLRQAQPAGAGERTDPDSQRPDADSQRPEPDPERPEHDPQRPEPVEGRGPGLRQAQPAGETRRAKSRTHGTTPTHPRPTRK